MLSVNSPFILFKISSKLKDLLQPGFPTINIGILLFIQQNKEKIFSNKALFLAIPLGISILSAIKFSSNFGIYKKSLKFSFSGKAFLNTPFNF